MAPQQKIPVAANVLGTIGTILWCVQLVPQVWTNWRTKKTDGLPSAMMFLWAVCGVPFGAYNIVQGFNIPLQVQPQCFMAMCLISWAQTLYYSHKWPLWKVCIVGPAAGVLCAGIEAALILTLRPLYNRGNDTPMIVVGVVAAIFLAAGLLPPYGEAWKRKGRIIGINWIFLAMDCLGGLFSLLSLAAQNNFDILGGVLYILVVILELGIFISHIVWRCRTRSIRRQANRDGKTFDDVAEEHERERRPFKFSERQSTRPWKRRKEDLETGSGSDA
ncbi:PQ loop repeat-domain-containing protein [Xylariaceae sp. FL0804]|nr:PQ loop repeat-domain-containing protein [Xylariaceae sp. FL0804]